MSCTVQKLLELSMFIDKDFRHTVNDPLSPKGSVKHQSWGEESF